MRTISYEESAAVGGALCEDLTMTVGLTGVSVSGSLSDWGKCFNDAVAWFSDAYYGAYATGVTGIPYGEAHVG